MDMRQLMAAMQGRGRGPPGGGVEMKLPDSSETVHISSLALLKMLKHGRAGIPMEVMGLMLGDFTDDYMVRVVDVFAMPQSGTGVSVEAVDPVYQQKFMEMIKQTGRSEVVVGWYHSHPGFGCWLSGVDIQTHQSFEQLSKRAVAVVVDPVQSVKGKVVIDAFRLINRQFMMLGIEPRQTTSNVSFLNKPSIQALIHGLNRHYYSMNIDFKKNDFEMAMLTNLYKRNWTSGLKPRKFEDLTGSNISAMERMAKLAEGYNKRIAEEDVKTDHELTVSTVGKIDPKRHLESSVSDLMSTNIVQCLATMLDTVAF